MTKGEKFTFLSADGKTTIHAVKWIPEDGKYGQFYRSHMA